MREKIGKKRERRRIKKHKNPVQPGELPGIDKMLTQALGPLLLHQVVRDATFEEITLLSALLPELLKMIRRAGGAAPALDKLGFDGAKNAEVS